MLNIIKLANMPPILLFLSSKSSNANHPTDAKTIAKPSNLFTSTFAHSAVSMAAHDTNHDKEVNRSSPSSPHPRLDSPLGRVQLKVSSGIILENRNSHSTRSITMPETFHAGVQSASQLFRSLFIAKANMAPEKTAINIPGTRQLLFGKSWERIITPRKCPTRLASMMKLYYFRSFT